MADKKYLDSDGLLYFYSGLKGKFVSDVTYNTTTHKFEKTKNGSTTEIVTAANLKTEMGLNNVGNFKAVSTEASQGLTEQEKANARANIGAGSSDFSGSFNDLTDVPTTISGYGITDAKIANGVITLGANTITPLTQHQDISGKADVATTLAGYGITDAYISNGTITLGANTITPLTQHQDISGKADKATTLAGYGITDAKIKNGTITLGANSITPLTSHQDISGKADKATTLAGYGITDAKIVNGVITLGAKTIKPLTSHQDISGKADKATTLAGYGITDAKIVKGVITLGANTITPLTQHQDISGKADKATTLAGYGITDAKIENGTITLGANSVSISGVYRYKGSVATYSALPATAEVGDVYNVESDGKNYAYTGVSGALWDDLGGSFTIVSITNSEIDTILAS